MNGARRIPGASAIVSAAILLLAHGNTRTSTAESGIGEEQPYAPATLRLGASPNPFNPATRIEFPLPQGGHATLTVHDLEGRRVRTLLDESLTAEDHAAAWDGRDGDARTLPTGVYFARLACGAETAVVKLVLLE